MTCLIAIYNKETHRIRKMLWMAVCTFDTFSHGILLRYRLLMIWTGALFLGKNCRNCWPAGPREWW